MAVPGTTRSSAPAIISYQTTKEGLLRAAPFITAARLAMALEKGPGSRPSQSADRTIVTSCWNGGARGEVMSSDCKQIELEEGEEARASLGFVR